jgi:hypothetical protein
MAAAKKSHSRSGGALAVLFRLTFGLLWGPLGATALLATALVGGWYLAWNFVGPGVLQSSRYILRQENLEISPPPEWIHTDVRAEVFRSLSFEGPLSIMDDGLTQRINDAFMLHPWVAHVHRVTKHHPSRVTVELDYRRPVCMVEVPGGLLPVDGEGAWLRSEDFSPVEASRYPRLTGVNLMPVGSVGTRWGDSRVVGGAEIAAALSPAWSELRLARIESSVRPESGEHFSYDLFTRAGTRILWGLPPGADVAGLVPAQEKVTRLRQFAAERGSLDGPHQLDLRSLRGLEVLPVQPR